LPSFFGSHPFAASDPPLA